MPTGVYQKARGDKSPFWRGGKTMTVHGYVGVFSSSKYKPEHIHVVECVLRQTLPPLAVVHHVNHIRHDNRKSNLVVCESATYHALLHLRERAYRATGDPTARRCSHCKKWEIDLSTGAINSYSFRHRICHAQYMRIAVSKKRRQAKNEIVEKSLGQD